MPLFARLSFLFPLSSFLFLEPPVNRLPISCSNPSSSSIGMPVTPLGSSGWPDGFAFQHLSLQALVGVVGPHEPVEMGAIGYLVGWDVEDVLSQRLTEIDLLSQEFLRSN